VDGIPATQIYEQVPLCLVTIVIAQRCLLNELEHCTIEHMISLLKHAYSPSISLLALSEHQHTALAV